MSCGSVKRGTVRTKAFRHTYCSNRLQTLDRGAPVPVYTVAKELGQRGDSLVKRVYGHLGEVRHRSDVVGYRIEHHAERLGELLTDLRVGGTAVASEARLASLDAAQKGPPNGPRKGPPSNAVP